MAEALTEGYVQHLKIMPAAQVAIVEIGPTPSDAEELRVLIPSSADASQCALRAEMISLLSSAMIAGRRVGATHDEADSDITGVGVLVP